MAFGLGLDRDDPEYRNGSRDFPELEDRIRLAVVVARAALFCAETEARVKNRLYAKTRNEADACWPQGARRELRRHEMALTAHRARQLRQILGRGSRPLDER